MKKFIFLFLMLFGSITSHAEVIDVSCPTEQEVLLKVVNFLPSADSQSARGQCIVSVATYSWWDMVDFEGPIMVNIAAGDCNSNDFIWGDQGTFIMASISYQFKISRCQSNPGCHYECRPIIKLWSL